MSSDIETLRAIEDLLEKYLKEESIEKLLSLYYIILQGHDTARRLIIMKFGSVKPYLQVSEDLSKAGVTEVPGEAKHLLSARESELNQLLIKDARALVEKFDVLTQRIVALALLILENKRALPGKVEELFDIYEFLTGEHIPQEARKECIRALLRVHLVRIRGDYSTYLEWDPLASYILKALKGVIPNIIVEFKEERREEK